MTNIEEATGIEGETVHSRRVLREGEYWCRFPRQPGGLPTLLLNPGPYFEKNAKQAGCKIGIVRMVVVEEL
jgi:hypothetical protein